MDQSWCVFMSWERNLIALKVILSLLCNIIKLPNVEWPWQGHAIKKFPLKTTLREQLTVVLEL